MPNDNDTRERLARIEASVSHMADDIKSLTAQLDSFGDKLDRRYARREDLALLRRILLGVGGAAGAFAVRYIAHMPL
jgi:hypothetical protein